MKRIISYSIFFVTIALFAFNNGEPLKENDQQRVQKAVDSIRLALEKTLGKAVPSLNVLIQTPEQKIFVTSAGSGGTPATASTYYRFASVTKNFTSTSILNMYEDGWLDYKASITDKIPGSDSTYIPNTPNWNLPNKNEITIERLLQHVAGVYDVDNDSVPGYHDTYVDFMQKADPSHQFSADELAGVVSSLRLFYFKPMQGYHYSNTGYTVLGEIISRVYSVKSQSHKSYADYIRDYIAGPSAKMPLHVRFPDMATDVTMPNPYIKGTEFLPDSTKVFDKYNVSAHVAEGNGYGTMDDLNNFIRSLMKGNNVLEPATVSIMQNDVSSNNSDYALGCTYRENFGYGHNGAKIGYLDVMAYDPETDVSLVVMLPLWDLRNDMQSFGICFNAIYDAGYAARSALGYSGKPH